MKILFLVCFLCLIDTVYGQTAPPNKRKVGFRIIGKDSINLHLDKDYFLIEDTCSSIIRYGHFNLQRHHFFGTFRDLNKLDPMTILSEGRYSDEGKLDGPMTLRYLNNNLQAKGRFINGVMDGDWEFFYEDGKPWMNFKAANNSIQIEQAWDKTGNKIVDAGNGEFKSDLKIYYWEGKLLNGVPNGTWKLKKTDDRTNTVISSETFKNGRFVKGSGAAGAYSDASRIALVTPDLLPVSNAARMQVSPTACDPSMSRKKILSAVYRDGSQSFNEVIKQYVTPFLQKSDLKIYNMYDMVFEGMVNTNGVIENIQLKSGHDDKVSSGLAKELRKLPHLEPALIDGKPARQPFTITFRFTEGWYSFSYRFLPVIM